MSAVGEDRAAPIFAQARLNVHFWGQKTALRRDRGRNGGYKSQK